MGGIIRPGEAICDIAPARDDLIINVRILPTDIDEVSVGSPARIMLTAFHARYLKQVKGEVINVSADSFKDESSNARYYMADVRIDYNDLKEVAPDIRITAGMPVEVFITTSTGTFADFLIQPIKRTFARTFRES